MLRRWRKKNSFDRLSAVVYNIASTVGFGWANSRQFRQQNLAVAF